MENRVQSKDTGTESSGLGEEDAEIPCSTETHNTGLDGLVNLGHHDIDKRMVDILRGGKVARDHVTGLLSLALHDHISRRLGAEEVDGAADKGWEGGLDEESDSPAPVALPVGEAHHDSDDGEGTDLEEGTKDTDDAISCVSRAKVGGKRLYSLSSNVRRRNLGNVL